MSESEVWLPVVGWEGLYEVSDHGSVRSLDRCITQANRWGTFERLYRGKVLQPTENSHGYNAVCLSRDGHVKNRKVGRLVAEAFLGPCPESMELCHGPAGQEDDSLSNVSWGTKSKNLGEDKLRDGTDPRGDRNGFARLTQNDVLEIHRLYNSERHLRHAGNRHMLSGRAWTRKALAMKFGVSESTIGAVLSGETWGWLVKEEVAV